MSVRSSRWIVVAVQLAVTGCGGGDAVAPHVGPAARLSVSSAPSASVVVGEGAGSMTVRVTDAAGAAVPGVLVKFTTGTLVTVAPDSVRTDVVGEAHASIVAGTKSGLAIVVASAGGSALTGQVTMLVTAGPAVQIVVNPKTARIFYVGDTLKLATTALDQYGNTLSAGALTFAVVDPSLLRVDAGGVVTALRQDGSTTVVVSSGVHADSSSIAVTAAGITPCTGVATPSQPPIGDLVTFSGTSSGCLAGTTTGAEYALIVFNSSLDGTFSLTATVTPSGIAAAPTASLALLSSPASLAEPTAPPMLARGSSAAAPVADETFHLRLHERVRRTVEAHAASARRWYAARTLAPAPTKVGAFSVAPSYSAIPASPVAGSILKVNVNANEDCTAPAYRGARVVAVGTRSIVLADTLNPANGFSDADYVRFAARFDTLVYPLDATAFGDPSDIDGNGRVAILFTRAVNELTPANSSSFVAGFFYGRDLLPATGASPCAGSNEGELMYMLVPDSAGEVNGNVRGRGFVDTITTGVLAHEMQHLINASRRLYVNPGAAIDEAVWLNEGLSHVAEELLYYRESGMLARGDLGDGAVRVGSMQTYPFFKADLAANFSRWIEYLQDPGDNSPTAADDELATRGATWTFLRYAADQLYSDDGDVWRRFDNSTTTGIGTLQVVFGSPVDLPRLFRDWTVANLLDDAGITTDPRFAHPSWNFRSLFGNTFGSYDPSHSIFTPIGSPLRVSPLTNGIGARVRVRGTSASYYRLAVGAGREALLGLASGAGPPSPQLQFIVVRTK
jgi:hypothetical protein